MIKNQWVYRSSLASLIVSLLLITSANAQDLNLAPDCSYGEINGVTVQPYFPGPDNDLVFYNPENNEILESWTVEDVQVILPECMHHISNNPPAPTIVDTPPENIDNQISGQEPMPAVSGGISSDAMANEMVAAHNAWRQQYNLSGLRWAPDLAQFAQNYANQLAANGCQMVHSQNNLGENLYAASPSTTTYSDGRVEIQVQNKTAKSVVDSWGDEVKWYDYNSNGCNAPPGESCGHFTQIIWSTTTEVGCAMAICPNKGQIWSCNYRPAGNMRGQRPY